MQAIAQSDLELRDLSGAVADPVYAKVKRRLLPFLFICYVINFIDRVNVSFAHLTLQKDIGLSDASYGLGVGLFFIGYVFLEVPSNLLLQRIGARKTLTRIMLLWGVISACMMFVQTPAEFYAARIFLGAAEAGFFPGVVLYLTYWFPAARRARVTSLLIAAAAVSGIVGGPVSGWILSHLGGTLNLHGWQWLFLLEGLPAIVAGVVAFFYLTDRPSEARWLTASERHLIEARLSAEEKEKSRLSPHSFSSALADPKVYIASLGYMVVPWAGSVINFWAPSIIRRSGISDLWQVGWLSSIPFIIGGIGMLIIGKSSDRKLERRWHFACCTFVSAASIALLPMAADNWMTSVALLTTATTGYLSAVSLFWTIPPAYLGGSALPGGIALISCIGQAGGFMAPIIIGKASELTGHLAAGLYVVVAVLIVGALAVLLGIPANSLHQLKES